jgi:hypothetical protein
LGEDYDNRIGEFGFSDAAHASQHHENGGDCRSCDASDGSFGFRRPDLHNFGLVWRAVSPAPGSGTGGHNGNCFLRETKILTAEGERNIEDLAVGDLLPTMFGGLRPVQWIGRYRYKKSDSSKPWAENALPVRIARSALAPNVPHADLYVTAAHSLLVDDVLVPAELLINGTTITRYEPEGDEVEFFHVKLESHDVIYAEGALAETLLNVEESAVNFAEYFRLYGMPTIEETPCVPVIPILGGRDELMSRARSALSPWIDLRDRADVVRDQLEEGAHSLV